MIAVYGIKNCDSCRKALRWLDGHAVAHVFHDLRAEPVSREQLAHWLASPFAEQLVNRRSTTWRTLTGAQKASEGEQLLSLLAAHPTLVKRPVFCDGPGPGASVLAVGFQPAALQDALGVTA